VTHRKSLPCHGLISHEILSMQQSEAMKNNQKR